MNEREFSRAEVVGLMSREEIVSHTQNTERLIAEGYQNGARDYLNRFITPNGSGAEDNAEIVYTQESNELSMRTRKQKIIGGLVVAAAAGALVFEQGPANEALRTKIGLDVLQASNSEIAVGSAIAGLTLAIEMGSSGLFALGVYKERERVDKLLSRFRKKEELQEDVKHEQEHKKEEKNEFVEKITDAGVALGIGAAIVVARKRVVDPKRTLKQDLVTGLKASSVIAGVSGIIGWLAAGGIRHAASVGMEKPAQYFVDYATDWKFWGVVIAAVYGGNFLKNRYTNWQQKRKDAPELANS